MATGLVQPPIPACHLLPAVARVTKTIKSRRVVSASHLRIKNFGFGEFLNGLGAINTINTSNTVKASGESTGLTDNVLEDLGAASGDYKAVPQIKANLNQSLQGINRGIFGVTSAKKTEIEGLVKLLEYQNPTPDPTENLDKASGCWKLLYSTITILGSKRTKLGLRDFVTLGDFFQTIDVSRGKAVNVIEFNVRGLKMLNGQLTIEASFHIASKSRVDIKYEDSTITPDQLMNVFRKNYDLLLSLFNPEGWLEISYVDETMRIGRDDKGNIFILERLEQGA